MKTFSLLLVLLPLGVLAGNHLKEDAPTSYTIPDYGDGYQYQTTDDIFVNADEWLILGRYYIT